MAVALPDLPRFLVLDPLSTVRVEMLLESPACEIDVELDNPRPGRSFVLLIGHKGGPYVQRVRLAGKARIYFDPQSPGEYVLLMANPQNEPIVLRLRARGVGPAATVSPTLRKAPSARRRSAASPSKARRKVPNHDPPARRPRSK
ncbi:MAG TPA: hypothetical protein VEH28_02435 [Thermoplasmata archaeon]|nr:hypothetical protein [Thermoplasmata archaeon]